MCPIRRFEDAPFQKLNYPEHVEKMSAKVLIDETLGLGMKNSTLLCLRIEPGGYTIPHKHDEQEEAYFYLSGEALVKLEDEEYRVGPYTTVLIPPGTTHSHKVIGDNPLILLALFVPPARRSFFTDNIWKG